MPPDDDDDDCIRVVPQISYKMMSLY